MRNLPETRSAGNSRRRRGWLLLVALVWVLQVPTASAAESAAGEASIGAASAVASLIYGPTKIVYATLGLLFSGGAWLLTGGDEDIAGPIYHASVRGDYVVTPDHLKGDRSLEFVGRDPRDGEGF